MMSVIGKAILARDRHVHARHQREMERHVAFVVVAEIFLGILRPLVGLGQQHPIGIVRVEFGADALQHRMGLRQVLVVGALRAPPGRAPRRAAARRRRVPARSAAPPAPPSARADCRSSGRAGASRSGASNRLRRPSSQVQLDRSRIDEDDAGAGVFLVVLSTRHRSRDTLEPGLACRARWNQGC